MSLPTSRAPPHWQLRLFTLVTNVHLTCYYWQSLLASSSARRRLRRHRHHLIFHVCRMQQSWIRRGLTISSLIILSHTNNPQIRCPLGYSYLSPPPLHQLLDYLYLHSLRRLHNVLFLEAGEKANVMIINPPSALPTANVCKAPVNLRVVYTSVADLENTAFLPQEEIDYQNVARLVP